MRCIKSLGPVLLLAACSSPLPPPASTPSSPSAAPPSQPSMGAPRAAPPRFAARDWNELRIHAAKRMVETNPDGTYLGTPPDILLAIPVLEIELSADGSIRRIEVLRYPGQARDTTQLAIDAVRRAAPFGDVSRLPRPWKFSETFLFNDQRKFKPRSLDV